MGLEKFHQRVWITAFVAVAACFLGARFAGAQTADQAQDRRDLFRGQATPTYGPAAPTEEVEQVIASPSDKDLGEQQILKRREEYLPFSFSASVPIYYTSNVALVNEGEEGDALFAPALAFTYQPRITKTLYAEVGLVQQWFLYSDFSELNFASFDAIAGLAYHLPQFHNLVLRVRYDYNRLTDTDDYDEFFVNHAYILSANMPFRIGRAQQIAVGTDIELSFNAHPDAPQRNDYSFYVGYLVNISRSFSVDASARIAVRDYHMGDRTDVSEILALSANYRVREWLVLSFLSSFAWNQSDRDVFDYSVADVGGAAALTIRF
jgi:hypothetical protein